MKEPISIISGNNLCSVPFSEVTPDHELRRYWVATGCTIPPPPEYKHEVLGWYGAAAPAKTPKAVIERLNSTMNRVLPELRERYENFGIEVAGDTPAQFAAFVRSEREKWARVVKLSGAKVE